MKIKNIYMKSILMFVMLLATFIGVDSLEKSIIGPVDVYANSWNKPGTGGSPTSPGVAWWLGVSSEKEGGNPSGPTAWEKYSSLQGDRSPSWLDTVINGLGVGHNGESLSTTCKKSDHIFWYGANMNGGDKFIDRNGNLKVVKPGYMFTESGDNRALWRDNPRRFKFETVLGDGESYWLTAMNSGIFKSNTVLLCSGQLNPPKAEPITIRANSKTVSYNGSIQYVSGYRHVAGSLKTGHSIQATAGASRRNPGRTKSDFTSARIVNKSGKDVTKEYKALYKEPGELIVEPPEVPPREVERCIDHKSDNATSIVERVVSGANGGPSNASLVEMRATERTSGGKAVDSGVPQEGEYYSVWESWKPRFLSGNYDSITPVLNLDASGVTKQLSTHGGVYNITETEMFERYDMTHCQPQKGIERTSFNEVPDGNGGIDYVPYTWTEWKDDGPRIIDVMSGPIKSEHYESYQNLVVNCNKEGFEQVKNSLSVGFKESSIGDGTASGYIETEKIIGANAGTLGKFGISSSPSFYTDGESCRKALTCVSDKLESGVENDADNNTGVSPLFNEQRADGSFGGVNDSGELVFFRDNTPREVRADTWYPILTRSGISDIDTQVGKGAVRTKANIYSGTPKLEITTIAPWMPEYSNSDGHLSPEDFRIEAPNIDREWGSHVNRFTMQSQWASDEGSPYQLGVNWRYHVNMWNIAPSSADAYNVVGTKTFDSEEDIYKVNAICEFKNNDGDGVEDSRPAIPGTPFAEPTNTKDVFRRKHAIRTLFNRSASREGKTSSGN